VSVKYTTLFDYFSSILYLVLDELLVGSLWGAAVDLLDGNGLPTCQVITGDTHVGLQIFTVHRV
jgi:hypothetical protein